jgi:hypothetical protein
LAALSFTFMSFTSFDAFFAASCGLDSNAMH